VLEAGPAAIFMRKPLWVEPGIRPSQILLDNPQELGADRIVNVVAGLEKYGAPLIAIDFGTPPRSMW